jgi:hypothetical protein
MTKKRKSVSPNETLNELSSNQPYRNINKLYTTATTLKCALGYSSLSSSISTKPCISCAYKIATFDIALDHSFTQSVKNVRPETCPRSIKDNGECHPSGLEGTYGYKKKMNILLIGDGDLTFSLALARMLCGSNDADNNKRNGSNSKSKKRGGKNRGTNNTISIVATSYESKSTLIKVYPSIEKTILELEKFKEVHIQYEVDATNIQKTIPYHIINNIKFHRIIWNFPCTAETNGQDGQNSQMDQNKLLVQKFVQNSVDHLQRGVGGGEIHMLHKTKPPYDQWNIEQVALDGWRENSVSDKSDDDDDDDDATTSNKGCPLEYKGRIVFDKCLLPPYVPRKALDKKSFPCHDACLNIFGWKEKQSQIKKAKEKVAKDGNDNNDYDDLSTIPICPMDANFEEVFDEDGQSTTEVIPVTESMIDEIRKVHLYHASIRGDKSGKKKKSKAKR